MKTLGRKLITALLTALTIPAFAVIMTLIMSGPRPAFGMAFFGSLVFLVSLPFILICGLPFTYLIDRLTSKWYFRMLLYLALGVFESAVWWLIDENSEAFQDLKSFYPHLLVAVYALTFGIIDNALLLLRKNPKQKDLPM